MNASNRTSTIFRAGACTALLATALPVQSAQQPKPNILFIFADDMAMDAVGAFGGELKTPHMDRLVAGGTSFMNTYNPGSWHGAVCIASRTMLMTGRSLFRAKALQSDLRKEVEERRFWPQLLEDAGYTTYMTGKWHVDANAAKAFTVARDIRPGMPNDFPEGYNRPLEGQPDPWSPYDPKFEGFWKGGKHWSEVQADHAIDFLREAKKDKKPFFIYLAFNAPHDPRQAPKRWVDQYPPESVTVPPNFLPLYPYRAPMGAGEGLRDEKLAPFPRTPRAVQVHRSEYYAITSHMDEQIGRVLDVLEREGLKKNTLIVFTGDHGLAVGHHGLMGKQNMYDHSMKVPMILTGPGMPAGKRNDALVYLQDIVPTLLEVGGARVPRHIDFRSMLPVVRGEKAEIHPALYGAYIEHQRMVREGDWKLIVYPKADKLRLFNLREDPFERDDLADDPAHAATKARLLKRLIELQKKQGDTIRHPIFSASPHSSTL